MKEIATEKAPGPSPSFSRVHVVRALELIAENPIGRSKLSKELVLGEGATRTLIERLKEYGLIAVDRAGCVLSRKGEKLWGALHEVLPRKTVLGKSELTLAPFNVAVLVKEYSGKVKFGVEQRDAALMIGAKGATTLVFKDGKVRFPLENRDVSRDLPKVSRKLVDSLKPEEDDVIVIGSAETLDKAEYGALAAALSLLNKESLANT